MDDLHELDQFLQGIHLAAVVYGQIPVVQGLLGAGDPVVAHIEPCGRADHPEAIAVPGTLAVEQRLSVAVVAKHICIAVQGNFVVILVVKPSLPTPVAEAVRHIVDRRPARAAGPPGT